VLNNKEQLWITVGSLFYKRHDMICNDLIYIKKLTVASLSSDILTAVIF